MKGLKVHVVSTPGWEDEFEAIAVFSSHNLAYAFVEKHRFASWVIEELIVDEPEED